MRERHASARLDAHQDHGCPLTRAAHPGLRLKKKICTMRAARHTIVLISLRCGQHHGDCRGAVTHYCSAFEYSILTAALGLGWPLLRKRSHQPSCRQSECFRLHDCIVRRSYHAGLQRRCSTAGSGGHAMPCGRPIMPYLISSHGS